MFDTSLKSTRTHYLQLRSQGQDRSLHRRDEAVACQVQFRRSACSRTSGSSHPGSPEAVVEHLQCRRQAKASGTGENNQSKNNNHFRSLHFCLTSRSLHRDICVMN